MPPSQKKKGALRTVGRYLSGLRSPNLKFLHDLAFLAGGQVVSKILGFLLYAYLARVLPTEDYGTMEYLMALTGFALLFVEFGLGQVAVRETTLQDGNRHVVTDVPALRVLIAMICIPVVLAATFLSTDDATARTLGCLFSGTLLLYGWKQEWLLQSAEKLHKVALAQMLRVVVGFGLVVALVRGPGDLVWVGVAELAAVAVWIGYFLVFQVQSGFPLVGPVRPVRLWRLWRRAVPLGLNSVVWGTVQTIPPILVFNIAGAEQAAYYAAGQRIMVSLQTMSYIYHFNMFASLIRRARESTGHIVRLSSASTRVTAWAAIGPAVFCSAYAGDLMAFVFGGSYRAAGPIFAVLIFAAPFQFLSGHQRWALTATGRFGAVLATGATGAGVALCASALLVGPYQALGAAVAALAATMAVWFTAWALCRYHGLHLPVLRYLIRPALVSGALVLGLHMAAPGWGAVPELLGGLAAYCGLIFVADRRFITDLRHLAYSKQDLRRA